MKKQTLIASTMLSLVVALAVTSVSAQSSHYFQVTIPFEFAISGKKLPPGEYIVRRISSDKPQWLSISSVNGRRGQSVLTHNVRAGKLQSESKLVFRRYGDQYFLSQVWEAGTATATNCANLEERVSSNVLWRRIRPSLKWWPSLADARDDETQ
jgi:hypothetical protein